MCKSTRDYRKAKTLRGQKDTLALVFFIGGGGGIASLPPPFPLRIDSVATNTNRRVFKYFPITPPFLSI